MAPDRCLRLSCRPCCSGRRGLPTWACWRFSVPVPCPGSEAVGRARLSRRGPHDRPAAVARRRHRGADRHAGWHAELGRLLHGRHPQRRQPRPRDPRRQHHGGAPRHHQPRQPAHDLHLRRLALAALRDGVSRRLRSRARTSALQEGSSASTWPRAPPPMSPPGRAAASARGSSTGAPTAGR